MSFSCVPCGKVFGDQVAASQHFQSVHNKAAYQASVRKAKQARKSKQAEEASQKNTSGIVTGSNGPPPSTYSNFPTDGTVLQQEFPPETSFSPNGPSSKGLDPSHVFDAPGQIIEGKQAPGPGMGSDNSQENALWRSALRDSQENSPWRRAIQDSQENSSWNRTQRDSQEKSPWHRASRDEPEDSPWLRALRTAEESSRWRMFLQNKGSRTNQHTSPRVTTSRISTYKNDLLPGGPGTTFSKDVWKNDESFSCKDYKSFFPKQETLESHIASTRHTMHRIPCPICHKPFPREKSIDEHLETVPHDCIYCKLPVKIREGVAPHLRFSHQFSCNTCGDCLPDSKAQHLHGVHGVTQLVYWCHICQPSCGLAFSTPEALEAHITSLNGSPSSRSPPETAAQSNNLPQYAPYKGHSDPPLEVNPKLEFKQLPGLGAPVQPGGSTILDKGPMYQCFTCNPPCRKIFNTQEARQAHLQSIRVKHPHKTVQHSKVGFLCNRCEPPCKEFFETQKALSTHHRYIEQKVKLEIEALEVGIRSLKEKSRLEIEAIEMQLRSMKETSRLEIEAMNAHIRSMREKFDTSHSSETLPSLACDICKPFCGNIFENEEALNAHLNTVIENAMDTRLTSIKESLRLNKTNLIETVFPLVCNTCTPPCSSTFDTQESQKRHLELMIKDSQFLITRYSKYQFLCDTCDPICGEIFDSWKALETHINSMIEGLKPQVPCGSLYGGCRPYCNCTSDAYGTQNVLGMHFTSIIDSSIDQFPCNTCSPSCGRIFDTHNALESHLEFVKEKIRRSAARSNKWPLLVIETPESIKNLQYMTHSEDILAKHEYFETPKNFKHQDQIKCINCHGIISKLEDAVCRYHPGKWQRTEEGSRPSCCGKKFKGCIVLENHITLNPTSSENITFQETPEPSPSNRKRKAVILGCGAGISTKNTTEIVQLSAIDYFTGEILIDTIVRPKNQIIDCRPRFSGVTEEIMRNAITGGDYLEHSEGARAELWKWIDNKTILIGHSLNHDLWLLRIKHHLIIDTSLTTSRSGRKSNNLKSLCQDLLGEKIQDDKSGYDCVEDLFAVRELVTLYGGNGGTLEEKAESIGRVKKIRGGKKEAKET